MPTLHALVFTGASSVANYQALLADGPIQIDEPQSHRLRHQSDADPDVGSYRMATAVSDGATTTTRYRCQRRSGGGGARRGRHHREHRRSLAGNVFNNNGFGPDSDPDGGAFAVTAVSGGTVGTQITLPSGALLIAQRRRHVQLRPQPQVRLSAGARLGRFQPDHHRHLHLHHHGRRYGDRDGDDQRRRYQRRPVRQRRHRQPGRRHRRRRLLRQQHRRRGDRGGERRLRHRGRVRRLYPAGRQQRRGAQYDRRRVDRHGLERRRDADQQQRAQHADRPRRQ